MLVMNEIRSFSFKRNFKFSLVRDEEETKLPLFDVFVNDRSINCGIYIYFLFIFTSDKLFVEKKGVKSRLIENFKY